MATTNYTPVPKVVAAGVAGALTVILVYLVQLFTGVEIPAEVASSITAVISFAAGYIKTDTRTTAN